MLYHIFYAFKIREGKKSLKIHKIIIKPHFEKNYLVATIHWHKWKEMPLPSVYSEFFSKVQVSEYNNFLTETLFISEIKFLDSHWIGLISHKNLMHFHVLVLLISWQNYSTMLQVRVKIYFFLLTTCQYNINFCHSFLLKQQF